MAKTKIEWTRRGDVPGYTFNPWIGCTHVSPGCDNCYAEYMMDTRYKRVSWGARQPRQRTSEAYWKQPYRWNKKAQQAGNQPLVFCASLADVFDGEVSPQWRRDAFRIMEETPFLQWLILTKRIENASRMLPSNWMESPPANIRIGVSAENQENLSRRVRVLSQLPFPNFISAEPLLAPITIEHLAKTNRIDWVIAGGESGANARPANITWFLKLKNECKATGIPFFMKQLGTHLSSGRGKGNDWESLPEILKIREFPD